MKQEPSEVEGKPKAAQQLEEKHVMEFLGIVVKFPKWASAMPKLLCRVRDGIDSWNGKKRFREKRGDYILKSLGGTAFVRAYCPKVGNIVPAHWLCCVCFNKEQRSELQFKGLRDGWDRWHCPTCNHSISVSPGLRPEVEPREGRTVASVGPDPDL